jgi:hypothetical protein
MRAMTDREQAIVNIIESAINVPWAYESPCLKCETLENIYNLLQPNTPLDWSKEPEKHNTIVKYEYTNPSEKVQAIGTALKGTTLIMLSLSTGTQYPQSVSINFDRLYGWYVTTTLGSTHRTIQLSSRTGEWITANDATYEDGYRSVIDALVGTGDWVNRHNGTFDRQQCEREMDEYENIR